MWWAFDEIYSNCLLVYDYLNGYVPPTPPDPPSIPIDKYKLMAMKIKMRRKKDDDIPKRKPPYLL